MNHAYSLLLVVTCLLYNSQAGIAQLTQTIRGRLLDKELKTGIVGASVFLSGDSTKKIATTTDVDGQFRFSNVPVGRHTLKLTLIGYRELLLTNILLDAGKEVILNLEMEELVNTIDEVEITATKKGTVNNDMTSVSSKNFSMEETNRYAGSRSDPARMASNLAGVQGANDSRNDIVIRGNSPAGLLWRVEGIDIINPNHFAVPGTTGGAISILNNKLFGSSDFMTGAFPAEYGNANAGVFDIRLRNGNNEKHEFTAQFGFLGTELAAEGPLSKTSGASYLFTYRYSTLKIFESLKIRIGTSGVPNYQDASFKLNFPTKKAGNFSVFGIGGISKINIVLSTKPIDEIELYGDNNRDQVFETGMGVTGITHTLPLSEKTYIKTTVALYGSDAHAFHKLFYRNPVNFNVDTIFNKLGYQFKTIKASVHFSAVHKFNAQHSIKAGMLADRYSFNLHDSNLIESKKNWDVRLNYSGTSLLLQPYLQWKYKITNNLTVNAGVHGTLFTFNNSKAVEPRAGIKWNFSASQAFSLGYGMHSQIQPIYTYFQQFKNSAGNYTLLNKNMDFSRSRHYVAAYENAFNANSRLIVETYYQQLSNIPVYTYSSSFSLINQGATFTRFFPEGALINKGTGYNYGIEFTVEKFFSKSFYYLFTTSLYNAKYKGSDNITRDADYNNNFAFNLLAGKEFKLDKSSNKVITTGTKITWTGGKRYTPADLQKSEVAGELIEIDSLRNSLQLNNYFRLDFKIGIKINTQRLTHELAIDLVNVLGTKNVFGLSYAPDPKNPNDNPIREEYQLGFLPLFYYKVDF
jgi:hypothetical protein